MSGEKKPIPLNPPAPQLQFPFEYYEVQPGKGMLVVLARSAREKQEILIPAPNADRLAIEWMGDRPKDVLKALLNYRHSREVENKLVAEAISHPTRLQG